MFFTDSALWAGSVIESPCPSVCGYVSMSVCAIGCSFFGEVFFTSPQIWGGVCVCVCGQKSQCLPYAGFSLNRPLGRFSQ